MTPAESVGPPETCEHSIPVAQSGLRVGGNMMLAQWCSQQGAHSGKDVGSVWQDYGCFRSLNVGRGVPRDDRNPGDKFERFNWLEHAGREERHR
jgi:hypothetical protein